MVQEARVGDMMIDRKRRWIHLVAKVVLLISLPLAGFSWAFSWDHTVPVMLTILSIAAAVVAEVLEEKERKVLEDRIAELNRLHTDDLAHRDEKIRQLDRVVDVLENHNHDMRAKLIISMARVNQKENPE